MAQQARSMVAVVALGLLVACGGGSGGSSGGALPDASASSVPVSAPATPAPTTAAPERGTRDASLPLPAPTPVASSNIIHEKRPDGGRIWTVNPDNDSVSVIDATSLHLVAEIPVGRNPRTLALAADGKIWVANRASGNISVLDPARLAVDRTVSLPPASQPFGIVFSPADGSPWVVLEALGRVSRLDRASGAVTASIDVGPNPRHVSMPASGRQVLVSRFISRPLPGESGARPAARTGAAAHGGEVVVLDPVALVVTNTIVLEVSDRQDSTFQARGLPNYLGAAAVAPDGKSAWVPSKQDNVMRGILRDGLPLDFQSTVRAVTSRIALVDSLLENEVGNEPGNEPENDAGNGHLRIDHDNSGVASAAAFHPSGRYLFVALETSRHVAVVDAVSGREISRAISGLAPQGLVVSEDGRRLFVNNFMDRTVAVFDLTRLVEDERLVLIARVPVVAGEKLAPAVLKGKQFFYDALDPRLARDGYLSCASCHADGAGDGRTWDFTGFGEGLRRTISLRGRAGGSRPLHWSGNFDETQDFENQIRAFAGGQGLMRDADFVERADPQGMPKAGASADLDALAAYVASLDTVDASPHRRADGSLTPDAVDGKALFAASGCLGCHGGPDFSGADDALHDIGTLKPSSGRRLGGALAGIDTPTLRGVWAGAPFLHDGSAAGVTEAIAAHSSAGALRPEDLARLAAYVMQIDARE